MAKPTIAVIGAGEVGLATLDILARHREAGFLVFDRDGERLDRARELGIPDLKTEAIEIVQGEPVPLPQVDLVINFVGPFYRWSDAVARGALAAGAMYIDICDDSEGAQVILGLDDEAKKAGVPLITGGGGSPGISDLMGKRLHELTECDGLRVVWVANDPSPGGLAPIRHMLHIAVTPSVVWENGNFVEGSRFQPESRQRYQFCSPLVGEIDCYDSAHPESALLAWAFPELKHVSVQGALAPPWANQAFSMLGRLGFAEDDFAVDVDGTAVNPSEFLWRMLWARHGKRAQRQGGYAGVKVIALDGEEELASFEAIDADPMARFTGIGLAAAAIEILDHRPAAGASGPEALDAERTMQRVLDIAALEGALDEGFVYTEGPRSMIEPEVSRV